MSTQAQDKQLFVDDVVTALTGSVVPSGDARPVLQDQMQRATEEFDLRTAEAFARALLEALCQEPIDPRRLEALLILGLAHPTILERHRISLQQEGERLAAMLTAQGQHARARTLLEVIAQAVAAGADGAAAEPESGAGSTTTDKASPASATGPDAKTLDRDHARIEQLLRQADEAAARGRTARAILLLQEIVTLDRGRRDVARMIRDLRWAEAERRARAVRRLKLTGAVLLLCAAAFGLAWREHDVRRRFEAIPRATPGELASMRARLESIDGLVAAERLWLGMASALTERTTLQRAIGEIEAREAATRSARALELSRASELAESLRARGLQLAQQGRFQEALDELRRALELGGPEWSGRREAQANASAIADWIANQPVDRGTAR
ncbi:MAG: tetratricopeptide repeat protein [Planctomycetes bacterium]|nr:tetratricopeptide repeat protein [Planctomycetota bacterium]